LGTPVLTSNTSAIPEAGGPHAHFFDPASVESMAHEIDRAIRDYVPRFARMREAAIARARTFTWQRAAALHADVYRKFAKGRA
jgi:glycosyltransferase involved in cell wall biosynthesis